MLKFNPRNIIAKRGIERTTAFLVGKIGMDPSTASRFLKSKSRFVRVSDIEKLCIALNCTPNDLFEWKPDADTILPETHSLNAIETRETAKNLQELVKDIPAHKLALIEQLLNELK